MSIILFLCFFVGVATCQHISNQDNDASVKPMTLGEARRICASLCLNGLGGKPCGKHCMYIAPTDFPIQSQNRTLHDAQQQQQHTIVPPTAGSNARRNVCPVLCEYNLGEPLCVCNQTNTNNAYDFSRVNFERICAFFCLTHSFKIEGCRTCDYYLKSDYKNDFDELLLLDNHAKRLAMVPRPKQQIDWEKWCREKCYQGDGGVACNCDILPFARPVQAAPPPPPTQ